MMKLAVWGVGLATIWGPLILMARLTMENVGPAGRELWYHMVRRFRNRCQLAWRAPEVGRRRQLDNPGYEEILMREDPIETRGSQRPGWRPQRQSTHLGLARSWRPPT
jgi:hypothetical protein